MDGFFQDLSQYAKGEHSILALSESCYKIISENQDINPLSIVPILKVILEYNNQLIRSIFLFKPSPENNYSFTTKYLPVTSFFHFMNLFLSKTILDDIVQNVFEFLNYTLYNHYDSNLLMGSCFIFCSNCSNVPKIVMSIVQNFILPSFNILFNKYISPSDQTWKYAFENLYTFHYNIFSAASNIDQNTVQNAFINAFTFYGIDQFFNQYFNYPQTEFEQKQFKRNIYQAICDLFEKRIYQ